MIWEVFRNLPPWNLIPPVPSSDQIPQGKQVPSIIWVRRTVLLQIPWGPVRPTSQLQWPSVIWIWSRNHDGHQKASMSSTLLHPMINCMIRTCTSARIFFTFYIFLGPACDRWLALQSCMHIVNFYPWERWCYELGLSLENSTSFNWETHLKYIIHIISRLGYFDYTSQPGSRWCFWRFIPTRLSSETHSFVAGQQLIKQCESFRLLILSQTCSCNWQDNAAIMLRLGNAGFDPLNGFWAKIMHSHAFSILSSFIFIVHSYGSLTISSLSSICIYCSYTILTMTSNHPLLPCHRHR